MIYIKDDFFLNEEILDVLVGDIDNFDKVNVGGKDFFVKIPSIDFVDIVKSKIERIEHREIDVVFSFIREANKGQDNDYRIHNDSIIQGQQPDRAAVLYITEDNEEGLNGTAFWEHKVFGDKFISKESEEFDRMLVEESNKVENWKLKTIVGHKKNRLLSYPCNYFHSKYPNEFENSRVVFVIFYKLKTK